MRDFDDETDDLLECELCAVVIDPDRDRAYRVSDNQVLCPVCATARGGVFDERRDTWVKAPEIADLAVAMP
jgi:hypothetical protein